MAQHLEAHGELRLTPQVKEQLQRVSLSTLRRIRRRFDAARTPFARLCETGVLPSEQEQALCQL